MLKRKSKKADAKEQPGKRRVSASNQQGIVASSNALLRVAALSLAVMLLAIGLGFAYLLLLREPALQQAQIDRVAESFSAQQATNIQHLLTGLEERMRGAARSPLALSAIASESNDDIGLVEKALLDYFPEVISLRIIPIGEMGTASFEGGSQGLRNHIEVDMVRRTAEGKKTLAESYQFEGRWMTSLAALVKHPRISDRQAVVIATIDNQLLSDHLKSLDAGAGKFTLEQLYTSPTGIERKDSIAVAGAGDGQPHAHSTAIPGSNWRVTFTPSMSLTQKLTIDPTPLLVVMGLCILAALVALGLLVYLYSRKLDSEINKVISAADLKTPLELAIPQLVSIAKQLRRATLRALRQSGAPGLADLPQPKVETLPPQSQDLTNPMFQSTKILDEDDGLDLDLASGSESKARGGAGGKPGFPDHIFRAYDIRGNASTELGDELVARIGKAIGSIAGEMGEQTLIVGCDGRKSSPRIKSVLVRALMESGRDVIDIGQVPTPLVYFATRHLNCRSGIMITGSHNPAEDNGLKIVLDQKTIAAGGIQQIHDRVLENNFSSGSGRMIRENVVPDYTEEVLSDIAIAVPLKIVIDASNGVTGDIAPQLFEELGCEVVPLYCEVDGTFPNHPPDTSNEANLADLAAAVQREGADFGVAFDGDGDRLAVVTSSGRIVRSDVLLMIYAEDVVSRNPGADVVFDVKCSRNLTQLITRYGGRPVLWKTGHAFMKEKMAETGALLGGEFSGHMFFGERWYGFDDGMYAAARLAEILSTHGDSLDTTIEHFPASVSTPEILIPVDEKDKFQLMEKIVRNADFSSGKVNTMDGIRVDFAEGWGLVRASNTSPALTARFEAEDADALQAIIAEFSAQLSLVDPALELDY
ncbi:MAG: phosphomannomutase/phosphoglucomutase [Halieaceae bacterium]|nr:phosphomannomutase/phosphoglucomutase [Halieaceae bacterium]MCP5163553.1 phosphomannomutase/phosphoglucomutase [Pseudomonadales bacterium]